MCVQIMDQYILLTPATKSVKYKKGFYEQKMSLRSSNSSIKRKINFRSQSMKLTKSPPPTQFDADIFIYDFEIAQIHENMQKKTIKRIRGILKRTDGLNQAVTH